MALILLAAGVVLLGLPGLLRRRANALDPREWVRLCLVALGGGLALVEVGLVLLAIPTLFAAAGLPDQATVCQRLLESFAPMGGAAGWALVAAAVGLPGCAWWRARGARRQATSMVVEPWVGERQSFGAHELVVMPCRDLVACSVEGPPQQIVVSEGLLDALSGEELAAVVSHEAAHLRYRHQRLLRLATAVETLPWAWHSTSALRKALERCADEDAAGAAPTGRSVLQGALMRVAGVQLRPGVAGLSGAENVLERLDALGAVPRRLRSSERAMLYLPGFAVAAPVMLSLAHWGSSLGPACLNVTRCVG